MTQLRSHWAWHSDRRADRGCRARSAAAAAHRSRRYAFRFHPLSPHQLSDLGGAFDPGDRAVLHPRAEFRHRLQGRHAAGSAEQVRPRRYRRDARDAEHAWARRHPVAAVRRSERRADPGGRAARRRRRAAGGRAEGSRRARRQRRISPRRSGRAARFRRIAGLRHARPDARDLLDPDLSLVPVRMAVRTGRHDRQRPRHRADDRLHVDLPGRFRPHQYRGAVDHSRLLAERHRRDLRPDPGNAAALQENADAAAAQRIRSIRHCRARSSPTSR